MSQTQPSLNILAVELKLLGQEARQSRGSDDLLLLRRLKALSRTAEALGRFTLQFGVGPLFWTVGMGSLAFHLSLEAQLNHAIMHGAYDGLPGTGGFTSDRYETLAIPFQSRTWREAHRIHHSKPSLLGEDPDTIHPFFRVHSQTRWRPWHVLNGLVGTFLVFELWAWDYDRFLKNRKCRSVRDLSELRKFLLYSCYQFVLFPWLAGSRWKTVLVAGLVATVVRNFVFVALQTGSSVGHKVSTRHPRAYGRKRPGEWARFQVETSKNFRLPRLWETLCGGLDRHIEHHLFPNLPPSRLHDLAPRVQELCRQHDVLYEMHPSIWASLKDSLEYLRRLASPRS